MTMTTIYEIHWYTADTAIDDGRYVVRNGGARHFGHMTFRHQI